MKKHTRAAAVLAAAILLAGVPTASFAVQDLARLFEQGAPIVRSADAGDAAGDAPAAADAGDAGDAPAVADGATDATGATDAGSAVLAAACDADSSAAATAAADGDKTSGLAGRTPLGENELRALWAALEEEPLSRDIYGQASDLASYSAATLSESAYEYSQGYINFIRSVAGLGTVSFDQALNDNAAQGALLSAKRNDGLSHSPETPEGVSDEQAAAGKYACANSNLSYSRGYASVLGTAIRGMVDDKAASTRGTVGHRRWILDPYTLSMGVGAADADGSFYTDLRVCGTSADYGSVSTGSADYEFVAWPASGNMPTQVFSAGTPWSVSLNPSLYAEPAFDEVSVTVTRESDGMAWTLDASDASGAVAAGEYFAVSNEGCGDVAYCIIFDPGTDNLGQAALEGGYRVCVSGLRLLSGEATSLSYSVDFFDLYEDAFERVAGADRYDTMRAALAQRADSLAGKPVVLTTGENYPDALSASALAGMLGGSVVLTAPGGLPEETKATLSLLRPSKIYVVGGTSAVSDAVMSAAAAYAAEGAERIGGATRVQTAERVYEKGGELGAWGGACIVASSQSFADAMSVSPLAYKCSYPIFLASASGDLEAGTLDLISKGGFDTVIVVGGEKAVSAKAEAKLAEVVSEKPVRLSGGDRYETNARIVEYELNVESFSLRNVAVATGANYPDALVGGTLCGSGNSVLLLVRGTGSSVAPHETLLREGKLHIEKGYVLGGQQAVTLQLLEQLNKVASR